MRRHYVTFCAIIVFVLCITGVGRTQSLPLDISLESIPLTPQPGAQVTVTATSYSADLSQADITWTYQGRTIAHGIGKSSISITAPQAGSIGTVSVTVVSPGFDAATGTLVLRPGSIDLLWEAADAYTPPFYKGKALLPTGGIIRISALTNVGVPKGLSYAWSQNGSALPEASGYEKSSVLIKQNPLNKQETISVQASGGVFSGGNSIHLQPVNPLIVAYQKKEGFIDYSKGYASDDSLSQSGAILRFEPYFFSIPRSLEADLSFDLRVNGVSASTSEKPEELRFSRPENGIAAITATITTIKYSLQNAERKFTLTFN